jgi:predicted TIM-barrel fold metal-dependent hydrolase
VAPRQVLLGTDFPFAPADAVRATVSDLQKLGLSDAELRDIEAGNAARLFRRFAG